MRPTSVTILKTAALILGLCSSALSSANMAKTSQNQVAAFPDVSLGAWQEQSFVGHTEYELLAQDGKNVLKATANNSASVLYKKDAIDLTQTPWLNWSWKITSTYLGIDERTKSGDDFPARLYVTAKTGPLPWQTIAINYVWSSHMPLDSVWPNPYTDKSIMVSVQSGEQLAGQWVSQRRNIAQDFKRLFDIDVKSLSGYALMVDGDNSAQSSTAFFGNIDFQVD